MRPTPRIVITAALKVGRGLDDPPARRHAVDEPPRVDHEHADARQRRGQPEAERHDQDEPERDAVDGDRAEHDDQRRRAGKDAAQIPSASMLRTVIAAPSAPGGAWVWPPGPSW